MTYKERLDIIKSEFSTTNIFEFIPLWEKEVKWLIEQAEKVEKVTIIFNDIESIQTWDEWKDKDLNNRIKDFLSR